MSLHRPGHTHHPRYTHILAYMYTRMHIPAYACMYKPTYIHLNCTLKRSALTKSIYVNKNTHMFEGFFLYLFLKEHTLYLCVNIPCPLQTFLRSQSRGFLANFQRDFANFRPTYSFNFSKRYQFRAS